MQCLLEMHGLAYSCTSLCNFFKNED